MDGGRFQGSNTSSDSGYMDLYVVPGGTSEKWYEVTITDPNSYRYLRYIGPDGSHGNVAEIEFYGGASSGTTPTSTPAPTPSPTPTPTSAPTQGNSVKLTGTLFGTSPSWAPGSEYDKAFDGDINTWFDNGNADGGYTGIDLGAGNAKQITEIRFYPRTGNTGRMEGGRFQGSNTSSDSGYTDLYVVPGGISEQWYEVTITDPNSYRYLRYIGPDGSYGNVAEIEFYGK
jgi:hypothetical protein